MIELRVLSIKNCILRHAIHNFIRIVRFVRRYFLGFIFYPHPGLAILSFSKEFKDSTDYILNDISYGILIVLVDLPLTLFSLMRRVIEHQILLRVAESSIYPKYTLKPFLTLQKYSDGQTVTSTH